MSAPNFAIIAFSILYIIRLFYDTYFAGNAAGNSVLLFYVVATLAPTIALACVRPGDWNERGAMLVSLMAGTLFVLMANWMLATGKGQEWIDQEIVTLNGGRQSFERLNPILLGHTAVTVVLISVSLIVNDASRKLKFALACLIVPSVYAVYLAASRGPILALIAGLALLLIGSRRGFFAAIAGIGVLIALSVFTNIDLQSLLEQMRFTSAGTDNNSTARIDYFYEALDAFLASPIIGSSFELPITGGWPHNVFIEVLMATGLLGGAVFLAALVPALVQTFRGVRQGTHIAGIILVQSIVGAQFSGSLWGTAGIWVGMAIALATRKEVSNGKIPQDAAYRWTAREQVRNPTRFQK